jgi:hypothetical protein
MLVYELTHSIHDFVHLTDAHLINAHLADPSPSPAPKDINTSGIVSFFASKIAPILLAVLGVIFLGRAGKGELSRVLTSSAIAIIGLVFIAGAVSLFFVGDYLVGLAFK